MTYVIKSLKNCRQYFYRYYRIYMPHIFCIYLAPVFWDNTIRCPVELYGTGNPDG